MRSPGLVVTQTLMFLFADIEGPAALAGRLGNAYGPVPADYGWLIAAGLAAHGG
jgi:hypothetical protein